MGLYHGGSLVGTIVGLVVSVLFGLLIGVIVYILVKKYLRRRAASGGQQQRQQSYSEPHGIWIPFKFAWPVYYRPSSSPPAVPPPPGYQWAAAPAYQPPPPPPPPPPAYQPSPTRGWGQSREKAQKKGTADAKTKKEGGSKRSAPVNAQPAKTTSVKYDKKRKDSAAPKKSSKR